MLHLSQTETQSASLHHIGLASIRDLRVADHRGGVTQHGIVFHMRWKTLFSTFFLIASYLTSKLVTTPTRCLGTCFWTFSDSKSRHRLVVSSEEAREWRGLGLTNVSQRRWGAAAWTRSSQAAAAATQQSFSPPRLGAVAISWCAVPM